VHRVRDLPCRGLRIVVDSSCVGSRADAVARRSASGSTSRRTIPATSKRFAFYVGKRCRASAIKDIAEELDLEWHTVKDPREAIHARAVGARRNRRPKVIGIDELSPESTHPSNRRQ
jgi:transposase